jgi:hypothetical protein
MRSRLLLAASAASLLALGACANSPTAPRRFDPNVKRWDMDPGATDTGCTGYHVATRADGGCG